MVRCYKFTVFEILRGFFYYHILCVRAIPTEVFLLSYIVCPCYHYI